MRTYEAMCVFRPEDEVFNRGKDEIRNELKALSATVVREEDMGQRQLAYPIDGQVQGHYFYFVVEMDPDEAAKTEEQMKHKETLLRFMLVRQES
jgi:small subunit ribosomal protein S6